jgi:hypothetical protein
VEEKYRQLTQVGKVDYREKPVYVIYNPNSGKRKDIKETIRQTF